jgi:hypothetical protein
MQTKGQLSEKIKRNLGYPMVKVELSEIQIYDAIDYARSKFMKYAVGNATQEVYFTMALSATQYMYDLPTGVTEVLSYETGSSETGGINTLFTVENYMYSRGMLDGLINSYEGYSLVSYHIARDFIDTLRRYTPDAYNYKYHKYTNQLEIQPPPASGATLTYTPKYASEAGVEVLGDEVTINSPGWVLIRSFMIQGSTTSPSWEINDSYEYIYDSTWVLDFATAYAKKMLGMVRRKFASFGSLGNQGIALDGSDLIGEADAEMERLSESLIAKEVYEGYGIEIG